MDGESRERAGEMLQSHYFSLVFLSLSLSVLLPPVPLALD